MELMHVVAIVIVGVILYFIRKAALNIKKHDYTEDHGWW